MKQTSKNVSDRDFYRLLAIVRSEKFHNLRKQILKEFLSIGFLVPNEGFSNTEDYNEWTKEIIQNNIDHYDYAKKVLLKFGIDIKNKDYEKYQPYIVMQLFFNTIHKPQADLLKYEFNPIVSKSERELWVRVYPEARTADWRNFWKQVELAQTQLPQYSQRSRSWTAFDRDLELYMLYLKTAGDKNHGKINILEFAKGAVSVKDPILTLMKHSPKYEPIKEEYSKIKNLKNFEDERLYAIIDKCKNVLGNLLLL